MPNNNLQNTSTVDTNTTSKAALVTELNSSYISHEQYSHARNAVRTSKEGDLGTIGNEPSNELCYSAPYKIIGAIPLPDGEDLIFSTDDTNSEIGIGNRKTCTYKTLNNNSCWGFNQNFPITGVAKKMFQKGTIVTFTDKNQLTKRVELNKLPTITDCNNTLLFKKIKLPNIKYKKGNIGTVPNGTYSIAITYSVDGQIFSDILSITNRITLYSEDSANSIHLELSNLDTEFKKFSLIVVGNYIDPVTKGVTKVAKNIGEYSTKTTKIAVTDFINPSYIEVPLSKLVVKKKTWEKVGIISSNSNYLILGDLVGRQEENYQLKAMQIDVEYVVEQVEADYYRNDGADVGFYRDENYDLYIQGIYDTGEETDKWHIGGRKATDKDLALASGADVYELDEQFKDCNKPDRVPKWMVENTAGEMIPYSNEFFCNRRVLGRGKMGYFESTEVYPDNPAMFGEDAGKPIRYHKFPDEVKVPRYSVVNGKTYINILGIRLKNIPKFNNPHIVGYKITRSDRKGGNGTVVARGIMTNVRSYTDQQTKQTVLYSNYTVNDLSPDQYISSTQTRFKNGKEEFFSPLADYHKDKFNFYSPHTSFEPRYHLGNEVKIEAVEVADVTGQFEIVYKHPKLKLLNQFSFWVSLAIGGIETYFEAQGLKNQQKFTTNQQFDGKTTDKGDATGSTSFNYNGTSDFGNVSTTGSAISKGGGSALSITGSGVADDIKALQDLIKSIKKGDVGGIKAYIKTIKSVLKLIADLGLTAALSIVSTIRYAQEVLDIIYNFTGYTDYVYQYNAHALFNQSIPVKSGNKRRRLKRDAVYVPSDVISIDDNVFNNFLREKSVYFELNKEILDPTIKDNSRKTISGFGIADRPTDKVKSTGSVFYATSKVQNPNQYGQLGSANPVSMHSGMLQFSDGDVTESPILYGGDCIITKFHVQKRMQFFNQNLANINYADGVEYDYRLYRNIGYPRFWLDSTKYDYSELLNQTTINFTKFTRTTTSKHNLDCAKDDKKSPVRIDDAYMYLSNNCVMEFFVEADYNVDYREKTQYPHYSKTNNNLSQIFRSDRLEFPEEFKISRAYSDIYTTEIFAQQQRYDFDPANPIPVNQPNSVIYSLPSFNLQNVDNWQYFLPANFFAFNEADFGQLTGIHKLDQDRLIFLFSKSSPYVSMGRDFLELEQSGRKITIGDGGLFAQDPREIMPTDNNYGSCNSKYAFSNTHLGRFYPSESQGRIINFTESLDDISREGVSQWCKNYMPILLYNYFPEYPEVENPVSGVGYLTAFDSNYETVYITKRDFVPKREYINDITYENNQFYYKSNKISVRDTRYFNDASWTISYSPLDKSFISWHDWYPDLVIQTDNHFMTVKDNGVWKHNESFSSFCNFYGKDYPFELEFVSTSGQQEHTVRSLEYLLEVYKYKNFGRDRFHVHHENFDRLIVHNSEQISPVLNLNYGTMDPELNLEWPKKNTSTNVSYDILYFKEGGKYHINQFWDSVKDRGEFTNAESHLFPTDESGYKRIINPLAIDIDKPEDQRKKFRSMWNKFLFIKTVSGANKFICKLTNVKKLISLR